MGVSGSPQLWGATRLDEPIANEGPVPRAATDSGRGVTGRARRAGRALPTPSSHLRALSETGCRSPCGRLGAGAPAPRAQPHSRRGHVSRRHGDAAVRARNSRENTSGPARTFVGDTGKERKFRRAQRAGATRSPSQPRGSAVSAQARGRSPSCRSAPRPCTSAAVGSYVTPGPPEAEGGTARTGAPRTRRPPVWLP